MLPLLMIGVPPAGAGPGRPRPVGAGPLLNPPPPPPGPDGSPITFPPGIGMGDLPVGLNGPIF